MQHTVQTEPPVARVEFGMNNWRAHILAAFSNGKVDREIKTTLNVDSFASKSRPVLQAKMPQTCFKSRHCPSHLNQIHLPRAVWVQLPATLFHDPSAQPKGDLWLRIWSKFEMTWRYYYRSLWNNDQSINHAQFPVVFLTFMLVCRTPWPRPYPCCHDGLNCTGKGHPTPWSNPLWNIAALPKR